MRSTAKPSIKQKLITTIWKQNEHHKHGVFMHTLKVTWWIIKDRNFKMFAAWLLHDIWKPFVSTRDGTEKLSYSFHFHEEESYQIIKNWPIISDYTKRLVRDHYLIRWRGKAKEKSIDMKRTKKDREFRNDVYIEQENRWSEHSEEFKNDLILFLRYDDYGKWYWIKK
jgi:hypothetical protein